jgi:hypothetical protein
VAQLEQNMARPHQVAAEGQLLEKLEDLGSGRGVAALRQLSRDSLRSAGALRPSLSSLG